MERLALPPLRWAPAAPSATSPGSRRGRRGSRSRTGRSAAAPSPEIEVTFFLLAPASALPISKTVCVMEASGHLGAALVEKLLNMGYIVHAAATSNRGDYNRLKGLGNKTLKAFRSDPFDYHSIVEALKGCSGLFYCFQQEQDQQSSYELMAEVEMRAALNVIEASAQTDTMERVVFTSSVTAVIWKENRKSATELDEKDWSDPNLCRKFKLWYALAKTLAEKTSWSLAMDRGVHMVSINGGLLTGPQLSATSPCLKGAPEMYKDGVLVLVDVDYLVAHSLGTLIAIAAICEERLQNRLRSAV